MKKMKITPILILNILSLVASLLLLIGSHTWFRGCENEEMNCHNAAILVRTVSYFALALSLLKLGLPQKQAKGGIAIGLFGFALLALLVPNALIELCMMDSMNIASIFVTAQYLRPKSLSDAPKWYNSLPSRIMKRS